MSTPFHEAARRMFKDAEELHESGRLGTPDHLYGIAGECALKAVLCGYGIITGTLPPRPFKKHINKLWNEYASQVQGRGMPSLGPNPFTGWQPADRYEDDAKFTATRVAAHREGALEGMKALQMAAQQGLVS